jgi:N4-gp56 family major capsid protein
MSGQLWSVDELGGYMYSDELSDVLRTALQPLMRFRQFCDAKDASEKGLNKGEEYTWNVYSDVATAGGELDETIAMPETNFTISQGRLVITEYGNSVPHTGKLDNLSKHPVSEIIQKALKNDANKAMERGAHAQFNRTLTWFAPASGTSTTAITTTTNGATAQTNNVAMNKTHVKLIVDHMKESNVPAYDGTNYMCIGRPSTFRGLKDELEAVHSYVDTGFGMILNGEVGRSYEGVRFFEQTAIPSEAWSNAKSNAAYFFGEDTVAEAIAIPEEIRGKIPSDYGRSKGVAWYYLGGFGIVHRNTADTAQSRIFKWGSAA